VRFGICYNIDYHPAVHGSPADYYETILRQVELLEELGYDSVWFSEHHCGNYSFGNPAVIAAAAIQRTKRIRIGTGVSLLPLQHPIHLAEQYGMLDVLSGGRLEYGIGRGYLMQEYEWFNVPIAESHGRYREAAEFIIKAWSQPGPMNFHGKYFNVENYQYYPQPIQRPHPPIYASAGTTPDSFIWAAKMGLNLGAPLFTPHLDRVVEGIASYRQTLRENGLDPADREVSLITQMFCAPTKEEALRIGGKFATNYYRFIFDLNRQSQFANQGKVSEEMATIRGEDLDARGQVLLGDPDDLIPRIRDIQARFGADFLLMEVAQGKAPPDQVVSALKLFGQEVLPHVQSRKSVAASILAPN
jgi:alkanesulfonate monooxygenase SsuD/methylene tetrahydromethanopterin reductase-like flavin-dependent oxidoreductase (luciferase family)